MGIEIYFHASQREWLISIYFILHLEKMPCIQPHRLNSQWHYSSYMSSIRLHLQSRAQILQCNFVFPSNQLSINLNIRNKRDSWNFFNKLQTFIVFDVSKESFSRHPVLLAWFFCIAINFQRCMRCRGLFQSWITWECLWLDARDMSQRYRQIHLGTIQSYWRGY